MIIILAINVEAYIENIVPTRPGNAHLSLTHKHASLKTCGIKIRILSTFIFVFQQYIYEYFFEIGRVSLYFTVI